jgi:hypothetical protein
MFKTMAFLTTLVVTLLAWGWIFKILHLSSSDIQFLERVKKKGKAIATSLQTQSTEQYRVGVRKDLWLTQEDRSRLHYRIESQKSTLTLVPINDKLDMIENLQQIHCWMQDKIYKQGDEMMQQIRFFEATDGTYRYSEERFAANDVALSLFRLRGTDLPYITDPSKAFLRGVAQDVSFSVVGKTTRFQAGRFKASLISQQGDKP